MLAEMLGLLLHFLYLQSLNPESCVKSNLTEKCNEVITADKVNEFTLLSVCPAG